MKKLVILFIAMMLIPCLLTGESKVSLGALVNYRSQQSFQEFNVNRGEIINISIPYNKSWILEAEGVFSNGQRGRILYGNPSRSIHSRGIEWFFWGRTSDLKIRLYNRKINFQYNGVRKGSVSTPQPPNHWAQTTSLRIKDNQPHKLRMEYNYAARTMQFYADGILIGDYDFIIGRMPSAVDSLKAEGFSGKIRFRLSNQIGNSTVSNNTNTGSNTTSSTNSTSGSSSSNANSGTSSGTQYNNSQNVKPGDTLNVSIPFDKNWTFELTGVFSRTPFAGRLLNGNRNIHTRRFDWFWGHNNDLCFRLACHRIFFTRNFRKGTVNNPYPPEQKNHVAATGRLNITDGNSHSLKLEYLYAQKRFKVYVDSTLKGDFEFAIKTMPVPARELFIDRFNGTIQYSVAGQGQSGTTGNQTGTSNSGTYTLNAGNSGSKTYHFLSSGTITVTPLLSTSRSAQIKAVIIKRGGQRTTWLKWNRSSASDPGPLYEYGKRISASMTNRGGDWSPQRPPSSYTCQMAAGDQVEISLTGSFGSGSPYVNIQVSGKVRAKRL